MNVLKNVRWVRVVVNVIGAVVLLWSAIMRLPFLVIDLHTAYANADSPAAMVAVSIGVALGVWIVIALYQLTASFMEPSAREAAEAAA